MSFAPQQDWEAYRSLVDKQTPSAVARRSVEEKFQVYCDLYNVIWVARSQQNSGPHVDHPRREEKLRLRMMLVATFQALDDHNRG